MTFLGVVWSGFGQIFQNDCSDFTDPGWSFNGVIQNSGYWLLSENTDFVTSETFGAYDNLILTSNLRSFGAGSAPSCFIEISIDGGSSWTGGNIPYSNIPNSYTDYTYNIGTLSGNNNKIRWRRSAGSRGLRINNLELSGDAILSNTQIDFTNSASNITEDGLFIDICGSITNASAFAATVVEINLDPSSTATNGADYDDGESTPGAIGFPLTLTFPAGSSADECFTIFISNDDNEVEGDETVVFNLTNPMGGDSAIIGTNAQHVLTIDDNEPTVIADVIITEIMYNTTGTDDEWIEICNTTTVPQILNNYTIEVNGATRFTFPSSGAVIAAGECITIGLGDSGDATFNPGCPFTPNYNNGSGTNNLPNSAGNKSITLLADNGIDTIDFVVYNISDGANGNGSSLHVVDDSLDNSDTGTNWQEVIDGGSPGINSLISQCSPIQPEINVEGDLNTFPNISDGDTTPSFLDNTRFSSLTIGVDPAETKSFRIQNIGTVNLNVSDLEIIGAAASDFNLTLPSALPLVIAPNTFVVFDISFLPSAEGARNATVRITNDDPSDNEDIFEFAILGTGLCDASSNIVTPLTGPANTVVTILGSDLDGSTFVELGGSVVAHTVISPNEIEITIHNGAISSNIVVTNNIGCVSTNLFTVINNAITSCEGTSGSATPGDFFISEVTDASSGATVM